MNFEWLWACATLFFQTIWVSLYLLYFFTECMAYISDNTCDLCSYLSLLSERVHAHIAKLLRVFVCISHLWGQTMIEWTLSRSVEACLPSFIALIVQGPWTSPTETMACVWTLKLTFEIIYFKRTMQYVSQLPSRCLVIVFFYPICVLVCWYTVRH